MIPSRQHWRTRCLISLISKPIFQTEQDNRDGARDIPKDAQNIPEMPCLQGFTLKLLCQVCCGDPALFPCLIPDFCTRQGATVFRQPFVRDTTPPRGRNQRKIKRFSNADRFSNRNQNASSQVVFHLEINESSSSHHSSDNKHSLESVPHLPSSCLHPVPCRSHCIASFHTPTPLGCNPSGHPASVGPACRRPVS